jgi:hypothetical protein
VTVSAEGSLPRRDADSTRAAHMSRILRGRVAGYSLAFGIVGAAVLGAFLREPLAVLLGPLAVAALVLGASYAAAARRSEQEFLVTFTRARGFTYTPHAELLPLTPLLGAGDRRECRHWMSGPLEEGLPSCGLGHYVFRVRRGTGEHACWASHDFTICVVDLEPGIAMYPGVFLERRRDLVDRLAGGRWLDTRTRRKVELESAALCERYDLWVERSQDELLLRELFAPSFVAWLAEHPLRPCFEYRAGALVVYVERRLKDAACLSWMLDATARIARCFAREVREAAGVRTA